jgi:hypothetical protein
MAVLDGFLLDGGEKGPVYRTLWCRLSIYTTAVLVRSFQGHAGRVTPMIS